MSYRGLLKHRCELLEFAETDDDGSVTYDWAVVATNVRCFLDLSLIRKGKDPQWAEAAGRPGDRTGVIFFLPGQTIKASQRIRMLRGPRGMFKVQSAIDEIWSPDKEHHSEVGVVEVATALTRKEDSQP